MDLILQDESGAILDAAVEVHRELGHGLLEKPYENALAFELELRGIPFSQQQSFPVNYKGRNIGDFVPDLIAFNQIIIDTKTIARIGEREPGQMMNYLKISGLKLGLIINFKLPGIEIRRVVL